MGSEKCTLEFGGALPRHRAKEFLNMLHSCGATYLAHERTLVSIGTSPEGDLLDRLEKGAAKVAFQRNAQHTMSDRLRGYLSESDLDYVWHWGPYFSIEPGTIFHDAQTKETCQFLSINERIVVDVVELQDPQRMKSVAIWSAWKPRPFSLYSSNHELLKAQASWHP